MSTRTISILITLASGLLAFLFVNTGNADANGTANTVTVDTLLQGIQFWSMINTGLSGAALVYLIKTEHRLTRLETQMEQHMLPATKG